MSIDCHGMQTRPPYPKFNSEQLGVRNPAKYLATQRTSHPDATLMHGVGEALYFGNEPMPNHGFISPLASRRESHTIADGVRNLEKMLLCPQSRCSKGANWSTSPSKRTSLHVPNAVSTSTIRATIPVEPASRAAGTTQQSDMDLLEQALNVSVLDGFTPSDSGLEDPDRFFGELLGKSAVPPDDLDGEEVIPADDKVCFDGADVFMESTKLGELPHFAGESFQMHVASAPTGSDFAPEQADKAISPSGPNYIRPQSFRGVRTGISLETILPSNDGSYADALPLNVQEPLKSGLLATRANVPAKESGQCSSRISDSSAPKEPVLVNFSKTEGVFDQSQLYQTHAFLPLHGASQESRETSPSSGMTSVAGMSPNDLTPDIAALDSLRRRFNLPLANEEEAKTHPDVTPIISVGDWNDNLSSGIEATVGNPIVPGYHGPASIRDRFKELPQDVQDRISDLRRKITQMPRRKLRGCLAREVTLREIEPLMVVNRDDLATMLSLGVTTWKSFVHHELGVSRWPARALKSVENKAREAIERLEAAQSEGRGEDVRELKNDLARLQADRNGLMQSLRTAAQKQRVNKKRARDGDETQECLTDDEDYEVKRQRRY